MISLGHVVIGLDFRWLAGGKAVFIGGISAEKKPSSPPCKVEFACCAVLLEISLLLASYRRRPSNLGFLSLLSPRPSSYLGAQLVCHQV